MDQEQKDYLLTSLRNEVKFSNEMNDFLRLQVEESLIYYLRYLEAIKEQIEERDAMRHTLVKSYSKLLDLGLFKNSSP